jgi:L-ascorbate metabolism protein UlaG (beta-lactamase superfamily)
MDGRFPVRQIKAQHGGVRGLWEAELKPGSMALAWLGQAGFALRFDALRLLVDPYLSDSLARKYRGTRYDHARLMPAPIRPDEITDLDFVLCSHRHSDHMDPGSLPALAANNPRCRFVAPAAERAAATAAGIPPDRAEWVNASQAVALATDAALHLTPAAHEEFKINERGEHHFLGFILRLGKVVLYHSGDTVPFAGQLDAVRNHSTAVALLPVNGRDEIRKSHGVPGNMTFEEALALCLAAGVKWLIPHHFGMFDFNTVDRRELEMKAAASQMVRCLVPSVNDWYAIEA